MAKVGGEDFASAMNTKPLEPEQDLPSAFPTRSAGLKERLSVKYGRFVVGSNGSPELEAIINKCLVREYILANEQWNFTGDGLTVVTIKYYVPEPKSAKPKDPEVHGIQGRRRLNKLLKKTES